MLIPNHPDEERLAALAGADPEATGDLALSRHVATCERCGTMLDELRMLRTALTDLPDLQPHRPLRLLPPVEAPTRPSVADRLAGLVSRVFMPALTAGAALALVGTVGTVAPNFGGTDGAPPQQAVENATTDLGAAGGGDGAAATASEAADGDVAPMASRAQGAASPEADQGGVAEALEATPTAGEFLDQGRDGAASAQPNAAERLAATELAERSPWPMLLFAGVALIIATLLLRWILAPRAD